MLRAELAAVDPALPMLDVRPLQEALDRSLRSETRLASLLSVFGILGLTLAAVGLYGVLSYMVARRTRELGLRKALGARPRDLAALLAGKGMSWTVLGAVVGAFLAWSARGLIASKLYGTEPGSPAVIASAVAVLLAVAAFSVYVPARRAAGVSPAEALRHE